MFQFNRTYIHRTFRYFLDFEKHHTYVVQDFIRVNEYRIMTVPDFRWASVPWMPGGNTDLWTTTKK